MAKPQRLSDREKINRRQENIDSVAPRSCASAALLLLLSPVQLRWSTPGTSRSSVSACSACSKAEDQMPFSSETLAETAGLPSTRISTLLGAVCPTSSAERAYFTAICL